MPVNRLIATICCILICLSLSAQYKEAQIKFGDIKAEDFKPQFYSIDSSADAVYLDDIGSVKHTGNTEGWFSVVYKVHERIRLLNKKSFDDLGTVKIPLYIKDNNKEKLDNLEAATYNLEDGKVVQTKVEKNSVFEEKDGDYQIMKFTFPGLKEGSIIEYTYTTTSPFYRDIPGFTFQGSYPELWSQYSIEEPGFFDVVLLKQGFLTPVIDTAILSSASFNVIEQNGTEASKEYSINSRTVKHTWAYKNVPALKEESYITSMRNYIEKVEFQFSAIQFPNETRETFMTSWTEMADQLMKNENFGENLSHDNGWLKSDIKDAVNGEADNLQRIKNIYLYVQNNYTCIDHSAVYLSQPLKKTEQSKKGNVSDINMLLVAMLHNAGYNADPVLLSTREHGKANDVYPLLLKYNYVVARVNVADKSYLLDASINNLGFNHLDEDCYNGYGRLVSSNPILINLSADSIKEAELTTMFIESDKDGKMDGSYKCLMGEIQSADFRNEMKKKNKEEYFKDVKKEFSFDVNLNDAEIDSLKNLEMPVSVSYNVNFKMDDDIVYFNPLVFANPLKENPFKSAQRTYPVEMPYCTDKTYIMNMRVPDGYKVDELPKSAKVLLNDDEGMFEYMIQKNDDLIQLRCRTKINKANFDPEDYETLRNFFAFIVEKEGEQIVFKKM